MQNLLRFIRMYNVLIVFLFLQGFSLNLYFNNNSYNNSLALKHTNSFKGKIYNVSNNISEYFFLKKVNDQLMEENNKLHNLLNNKEAKVKTDKNQKYISAKIINNSIHKRDNFITINKGKRHGIKDGMGVICGNGVLGIVHSTSENYSLIISVLNKESAISICLKKQNNYGSLKWYGFNYQQANIEGIPNHVSVKHGDTIITNGYSTIFPAGIEIGTVISNKENSETGNQEIKINLFTDFNNIRYAYIVSSEETFEQLKLEALEDE